MMGQITIVLRRAGWRLGVSRFVEALVVVSTAILGLCILARVAQQVFTFEVPWMAVLLYGPAAALLLALVYSVARRPGSAAVARRVDEGADLREAISTALAVSPARDAWSAAVVQDAQERAAKVDVSRAVPISAPRWWPSPLVAALVLFVVWITVPELDVLGRGSRAKAAQEDVRKLDEVKAQSEAAVAKVAEAVKRLDPKAAEGADPEIPKAAKLTPEDIRRAAVKNLTNLKEKLEAMKSGEKAQAAQQMMDKLKQLRTPGQGPLTDLSRELGKGDFKQAAEALKQLGEKLGANQLSEKEMEQLKAQLDAMAKQLSDLAKDQTALAQKLGEMGLDPKLAQDPAALQKALEAGSKLAQHLTEQQKQQLRNAAQAMQQSSQVCQNLSQAMKQAAGQCGKSGMSQQGMQSMANMGGQMADMEAMAQDLASMQAGLAEANHQLSQMAGQMGSGQSPGMGACKNGMMGNGRFGEGELASTGAGRGGAGRSQGGGGVGEAEAPEKYEARKFRTSNTGEGPIIGSTVVEGESVKGEAKAAFQQAVAAAEHTMAQALEGNLVERPYQDAVKKYFSQLKAKSGGAAPGAPASPAKPATDAGK